MSNSNLSLGLFFPGHPPTHIVVGVSSFTKLYCTDDKVCAELVRDIRLGHVVFESPCSTIVHSVSVTDCVYCYLYIQVHVHVYTYFDEYLCLGAHAQVRYTVVCLLAYTVHNYIIILALC